MGNFFTISNCKTDRYSPINLPIFSIVGYGESKEESLKSLNCCLRYNFGKQINNENNGAFYICSDNNLVHYAYVAEENGVYKCYLK